MYVQFVVYVVYVPEILYDDNDDKRHRHILAFCRSIFGHILFSVWFAFSPFRLFASSASSPTSSPNHGFSDASSDQAYGNMFACRPSPTLTTLYSTPQCAYGTNVLDLR